RGKWRRSWIRGCTTTSSRDSGGSRWKFNSDLTTRCLLFGGSGGKAAVWKIGMVEVAKELVHISINFFLLIILEDRDRINLELKENIFS
ncbi:hypothetical protein LINPERPRIM_LOCUS8880, partial [Linum perenne]